MAEGESPQAIIQSGLQDALDTMEGMLGNAGQETIYRDYVIEAFRSNVGPVDEGWEEVELDDYMDFMGEIIAEGNAIMDETYDYAQEVQAIESELTGGLSDIFD
jgi:hypothetical protein